MSHTQKLYLAATGMLSPLGDSPEMTAASLKAGISAYRVSDYENLQDDFITMTGIPEEIFTDFEIEIDQGNECCERYDRILKMAILAVSQVFQRHPVTTPVPMVLSLAESMPYGPNISPEVMLDNLINQAELPIDRQLVRTVHTGRAAVLQSLDLAQRFLYDLEQDYVLVGASDSYWDFSTLACLDEAERALAPGVKNAFAPGEGACFLLLTRHPEKALIQNGQIIALNPAGVSQEPGHLNSEQSYRGEGLHQAFLQALQGYEGEGIHSVYSSMNGEHYWAKEYGVAMTRNQASFRQEVHHHHPADSYGDLGAATGAALIALAAEDLRKIKGPATHLVYASSDSAWRAALRLEKISLHPTVNPNTRPALEASIP
jgi:3-oxoacyl-[acyl-carrier-protein] synthase-1